MFRLIMATILTAYSAATLAGGVEGKWRTESNDEGGYLEVTVGPCASDADKICGIITSAFTKNGPNSDYVNLGKPIVKDMESSDGIAFSGGTIWDPGKDKTYKSRMSLNGDNMEVKGCVGFICSGENWQRVN